MKILILNKWIIEHVGGGGACITAVIFFPAPSFFSHYFKNLGLSFCNPSLSKKNTLHFIPRYNIIQVSIYFDPEVEDSGDRYLNLPLHFPFLLRVLEFFPYIYIYMIWMKTLLKNTKTLWLNIWEGRGSTYHGRDIFTPYPSLLFPSIV